MKAGIVQFDVESGNVRGNVGKAVMGIRRLAERGASAVLLPEMWTCGFDYSRMADHAALTPEILKDLAALARECRVTVAGSLPVLDGRAVKNTLVCIGDNGTVLCDYAKIHLFSPGGEHEHFMAGADPAVCDMVLGKTGFMICYDLRFPELCRNLALSGAKIIMVVAQWPLARAAHWETLLKARAIENQVYVLAANRCGEDGKQAYAGRSMIVTPWGEILAEGGSDETDLLADIDPAEVDRVRSAIPCFTDRRPTVYGERG